MTDLDRERLARAYLLAAAPLGSRKVIDLVWEFGPALAAELVAASIGDTWQPAATATMRQCETEGARLVIPGDEEWPAVLRKDPWTAPLGLWARGRGRLDQLAARSVAIAGRVNATPYGTEAAYGLGLHLAQAGWTVVTLGRYGIDSAALRGAVGKELPPRDHPTRPPEPEPRRPAAPAMVLPSGRLVAPSPAHNSRLFDRVRIDGALVSEHGDNSPDPDRPHRRQTDLLIALTAAVILVEPDPRGRDARIATAAQDAGRPLLAIPGAITSTDSTYANTLIRSDLARLAGGHLDVLADLAETGPAR